MGALARMFRRGLPVVLPVAAIAVVFGLTSAAELTAAQESSEVAAEAPASIEPPAARRVAVREERPTEPPRNRSAAAALQRTSEPGRPAKLAASEAGRRESKPALAEVTRSAASEAVTKPASAPSSLGDSLVGVGAKLLLGSLLLAGLLYGAAHLVRRMPIARLLPGTDGPIKVIGRTPLAPKVSVALVQAEGATVLVAISPSGVQTLHTWTGTSIGTSAAAKTPAASTPTAPGQLRGLANRLTEGR